MLNREVICPLFYARLTFYRCFPTWRLGVLTLQSLLAPQSPLFITLSALSWTSTFYLEPPLAHKFSVSLAEIGAPPPGSNVLRARPVHTCNNWGAESCAGHPQHCSCPTSAQNALDPGKEWDRVLTALQLPSLSTKCNVCTGPWWGVGQSAHSEPLTPRPPGWCPHPSQALQC